MFMKTPSMKTIIQVPWVKLTTGTSAARHAHHREPLRSLDGMARLVARDGHAGHRSARHVIGGEVQVVITRIVVIGQAPRHAHDAHLAAPVRVEHPARDVGAAGAVRGHGWPYAVGAVDIALGREAEDRGRDDEQQVCRIDAEAYPKP